MHSFSHTHTQWIVLHSWFLIIKPQHPNHTHNHPRLQASLQSCVTRCGSAFKPFLYVKRKHYVWMMSTLFKKGCNDILKRPFCRVISNLWVAGKFKQCCENDWPRFTLEIFPAGQETALVQKCCFLSNVNIYMDAVCLTVCLRNSLRSYYLILKGVVQSFSTISGWMSRSFSPPSLSFLLPTSQLRGQVGPCRYRATQSTRPLSPRGPSKRTPATLTATAASSMGCTNRHININ